MSATRKVHGEVLNTFRYAPKFNIGILYLTLHPCLISFKVTEVLAGEAVASMVIGPLTRIKAPLAHCHSHGSLL